MKGFFTPQETESTSRPNGKILSCISCGAYRDCSTPKQGVQGNGLKRILIVGTAPESRDDKTSSLFQSRTAKFLKTTLEGLGIDLFEDCWLTNSIKCYLPTTEGNRKPTNYEIDCCRHYVMAAIKTLKPKVVILLGNSALYSVIGNRWKRDLNTVDKWRGYCIPDQQLMTYICPTFSHSYVEGLHQKRPEALTIWKQDLQQAIDKSNEKYFPVYLEPNIEYLTDDLLPVLSTIKSGSIAFDFETTGLKPHAEGHRIVCCSVAYSAKNVYVFMMPKSKAARKPFTDLLLNPNVQKIAQNMKFEDTWTKVRLGIDVVGWSWDTMQWTHTMDNRSNVSNLKFQTYVRFGIVDYESEVSPYLKAKEEGSANAINQIDELLKKPGGKKALLRYCALDSINEYRLYEFQYELNIPF